MSEQVSEQVIEDVIAVRQNEDYCSNCVVCASLCPYEAITKNTETNEVRIDIEKCQVCGLCYSTCPAHAIDTFYYDIDSLVRYLEKARQENKSRTLVIMCKGSAPDFSGVKDMFGIEDFIPLSVPCVGRIPEEMFLKAIDMGIDKIKVLACDEDYCRFQRGSPVTYRKILALNILLEQLGYGKEAITLQQNSLKVKVDTDLCIACGNCVYYCPYGAAKLDTGVVNFDLSLCRGCGLCVAMCPAFALDLENWEKDRIGEMIPKLAAEMQSPKILVFRCQWAVFPSLNGDSEPNVRYIDLPCASRTDVAHVLAAFQNGVDGVMIAACPEDECKQEKSSERAEHTIGKLKERLSQIGLQDRLHYYSAVPRYPEAFKRELAQFSESIKALG